MTAFDLNHYLTDRPQARRRGPAPRPPRIAGADDPGRLKEGMRYAVLLGGKRMRPMIVIAACEAAGGHRGGPCPPSCALEMIHAYSLVHDDLPAMDNDLERRGQADRPRRLRSRPGDPHRRRACSPAPSRSSRRGARRRPRTTLPRGRPPRPPRRHPRHGRRPGPRHRPRPGHPLARAARASALAQDRGPLRRRRGHGRAVWPTPARPRSATSRRGA
jgi:hypothetical protein